jgi:O-acetyl-ADP-ribose deacetylase (regulator of RNase III)
MPIEDTLGNPSDMIIHIVNCKGIMRGGIAKGISSRYPKVEEEYIRYCHQVREKALGTLQVCLVQKDPPLYIANLFAINIPNFNWYKQKENRDRVVIYPALGSALASLATYIRLLEIDTAQFKIGVPMGMGTARGGADWTIVKEHVDYYLGNTQLNYYNINDHHYGNYHDR